MYSLTVNFLYKTSQRIRNCKLQILNMVFSNRFLQIFILLLTAPICFSRFIVLIDENSENLIGGFRAGLTEYDALNGGNSYDFAVVMYRNNSNWNEVCQQISVGVSAVLDLTHQLYYEFILRDFFVSKSIPYFKVEVPMDLLIKGGNALMEAKNSTNGFLIFHNDRDVGRGIHLILGTTLIRYAFLNEETMADLIVEKFEYGTPSGVLLFGDGPDLEAFVRDYATVLKDLTDWIFSFNSLQAILPSLNVPFAYMRGYFDEALCCKLLSRPLASSKACTPADCAGDPTELYLKKLAFVASAALKELEGKVLNVSCNSSDSSNGDPKFVKDFSKQLEEKSAGLYILQNENLLLNAAVKYEEVANRSTKIVGQYTTSTGFVHSPTHQFKERPTYYRIGIVHSPPWTYYNSTSGEWVGYCIDLTNELASRMNFTYDFVLSKTFGNRDNVTGRWDGLTGDLVHGKIDIALAAYMMTSEREEYIDFVSPYFEQSGLIIAMQRPIVQNSLFKFMTVLLPEVWFSIAGATVATGLVLWILDKYSPYSAQNNPHKYTKFRKFTLKESIWFALTSFTPQGGGEPPKALSARILVAAYWIFVVVMFATFTSNLAAFLTVERMQSPIRNLEHLASQSSVKYSVMEESNANRFFKNMANAEELLFQMWRNLSLRAPTSDRQYIVWEYPVREMYIHINAVIENTGYVKNYTEGLEKAAKDGYYAFIHDSAQTRYEVFRNCNLTLIGEPFAESPYAIAVGQGNPLQDSISVAMLKLQSDQVFEKLSAKYWTSQCQAGEGDDDGISLESLGGVFIATVIGLGIAFISLAVELFATARNRKKAKMEMELIRPKYLVPTDFYGGSKMFEKKIKSGNFIPGVLN